MLLLGAKLVKQIEWYFNHAKASSSFYSLSDRQEHAIPLFVNNNILPINLLYYKNVIALMHDVKNKLAPVNILNLFQNTSNVHSYNTWSSSLGNFYIKKSNLEIKRKSFPRVGAKWWNEIPNSLRKQVFKKKIHRISSLTKRCLS